MDTQLKMKDQAFDICRQVLAFSKSYDSIICVAGGFELSSIKDKHIFDIYERQDRVNFQSALLAGHIATKCLDEEGMLMFTGAAAVFEGPVNYAYAYYLAKSTTHALALQLAERKEIPENSDVVTLLPQIIDTPANRASMPDADTSEWTPLDKLAMMIRQWSDKENRPVNGSFAKVNFKNGVVYPTFL